MKTYSPKINARIWTGRLLAAGLGLAGLACFAANSAAADDQTSQNNTPQAWEDQFTQRMEHIQKEMDDLFHDSVSGLDRTIDTSMFAGPRFDASATVQDRGDNYVATFNLPKRDLSNVKVNVKDGILSVNAVAEQTTKSNDKSGTASETEMLNQYEQLVTLPGPVDSTKMKVDKNGDSIVVTIPKKDEKTASAK
jgi:HSP20 family molecular chaperone IbpA